MTKKELNVAYGTLDMRIGHGLEVAEKQIKELSKKKPKEWYFDIIHTSNQTPRALAWLTEVKAFLVKYSKLPDIAITLHLNTNDRVLRARNALYEKIYEKDIKDVQLKKVD